MEEEKKNKNWRLELCVLHALRNYHNHSQAILFTEDRNDFEVDTTYSIKPTHFPAVFSV